MMVFNYSTTVKAFVIYLTELLRVAKKKAQVLYFLLFLSAHLGKFVIRGLETWIGGSSQCSAMLSKWVLTSWSVGSGHHIGVFFWDGCCWVHRAGGGGNSSSLV